jgi:hypothetical protein
MPVLNIKPYEPTYIGKPVEAISNMLKTLDSNNERITDSYRSVNTTLSQLPVNDVDRGLISKYKSELDTRLDEALSSDDYNNISTVLKGSYDNIVTSPEINAAVSRNKQYQDYRNNIANMYYSGKGDISKAQYDYYYNRPFDQTVPDENGVFNQTLNMPTPARAVDFGQFATKVLSTIMEDGGSNIVNDYMTNEEVASFMGQDLGNADPKAKSSFKKASNYVTSRGVSRDKRRKVLKDAIATDQDLNAYIDDLVKIDNEQGGTQTKESMLNAMMEPYVNGAGYITTEQERDNDYRFLYQQRLLNERAQSRRTYRNEQGEEVPIPTSEARDVIGAINIDPAVNKITDKLDTSFNWNTLSTDYNNLRLDVNTPNYDSEVFVNDMADSKYGRSFNELNKQERKALIEELESGTAYPAKSHFVVSSPYPSEDIVKAKTLELFGGTNINFKEGSNINGTGSQRPFYNLETGEFIEAGKVNEYMAKKYQGKKADVRVTGDMANDNPIVQQTGNFQFSGGIVAKVAGDTYIVGGSYFDNEGQVNEQIRDVFKTVEEGKYATRKINDLRPEQKVAGKPISYEMQISKTKRNSDGKDIIILRTNAKGDRNSKNEILRPQRFEAATSDSLAAQFRMWVDEIDALHATTGTQQEVNYKDKLRNTK